MMCAERIPARRLALLAACCILYALSPSMAMADPPQSETGAAVAPAASSAVPGTNVLGSDDAAAVGLIVLPWKPLPGPNADRSPNLFRGADQPLDGAVLREQIDIDMDRDALLRAQLEQGR